MKMGLKGTTTLAQASTIWKQRLLGILCCWSLELVSYAVGKEELVTHLDLQLHSDVSGLRSVVSSFSLCSDHRTPHMHVFRTIALCVYHTALCCTVLNSLCALGNTFFLALCHMLAAARVVLGSCDQYSKPM